MSYLEDGDKIIWHICVLSRAFPSVQWREKSKCVAKRLQRRGSRLQCSCYSEGGCGAFQLLGLFSSVTCASAGTECSQGPSRWLHGSFLHGFQWFESSFFDSLWYWVSTTPMYFPSVALLSFLDYLNVAKTSLWSNSEFHLTALAGAEWTRVHLVLHTLECSVCVGDQSWVFLSQKSKGGQGQWVWIWVMRVCNEQLRMSPQPPFPLKQLCSAFPIHTATGTVDIMVKTKEEAASACVFVWL